MVFARVHPKVKQTRKITKAQSKWKIIQPCFIQYIKRKRICLIQTTCFFNLQLATRFSLLLMYLDDFASRIGLAMLLTEKSGAVVAFVLFFEVKQLLSISHNFPILLWAQETEKHTLQGLHAWGWLRVYGLLRVWNKHLGSSGLEDFRLHFGIPSWLPAVRDYMRLHGPTRLIYTYIPYLHPVYLSYKVELDTVALYLLELLYYCIQTAILAAIRSTCNAIIVQYITCII